MTLNANRLQHHDEPRVSVVFPLAINGGVGGGGGSTPPPQPPAAETYTATAVAIDLQRSADGQVLPVDGLPAQGATLTVD